MIIVVRLGAAAIGAVEVPNQIDRETLLDLFLQWHTSVIGTDFTSVDAMIKSLVTYYASHTIPCRQVLYTEIKIDDVVAIEKELRLLAPNR